MRFMETRIIGNEACPLFKRLTILDIKGYTLKLHRFFPNADDRDAHDHPWPFWTLVLRGGYDDMAPLDHYYAEFQTRTRLPFIPFGDELATGYVVRDRLRAGVFRRRPAEHVHRTRVHPDGCTTLVLTFPVERLWGFWRDGRWWPSMRYDEEFGPGMRCDDE